MKIGESFTYPEEQWQLREKAKTLSWLSIGLLTSAAVFLFFALGQSEAMKTAWVSDVLTALPPVALLGAMHVELRGRSRRFPYGFTRSISVAFLVTSGVLSLVGLYLLYDSLSKLVAQERPPIGTTQMFGHTFWSGWLMIAALSYSLLCGLTLGLLKKPVAMRLNDKALRAEATMNRDEWLSEGAAIVGIVLVGFGHWWGDAVAAAFISIEIVHDGWINMRLVLGDLMDETPTKMGNKELEDITDKVRSRVESLADVAVAAVRLREHGRAVTGEVFIVPRDHADVVDLVSEVADEATDIDWRLHDVTVMPVPKLDSITPPKVSSS
jgi:cation diffusion facilitator family transporter